MASFKGNGRDHGSKRRSGDPRRRRFETPGLEALENRRLLSTATPGGGVASPFQPTDNNPYDIQNGPLANAGADLIQVFHDYNNYVAAGSHGQFQSTLASRIQFQGTSVAVDVRGTGDFNSFQQTLAGLGMQISTSNAQLKIVEGYLPIGQLQAVARSPQTIGVDPVYKPFTHFIGKANNEADASLAANIARSQYKVDGTGQKIGVISDSVNQYKGGLADSIATGDLPSNVQVLQDGPAGSTDEGRAMLENIHDIAPGAALAFSTGASSDPTGALGPLGFHNAIIALAAAGSTVIVDDLGYSNEPFYQDGIIQQAVDQVTSQGVVYVSAAGNAADSGYQSQFRGVNATVAGLGAGRYMNFDATGATQTTMLPIGVYASSHPTFEFDQPNYTAAGVTSEVDFYVLDQAGNIVSQGVSNNVATQSPIQLLDRLVPTGLYNVVIKVASGPDPGHVVFAEVGDGGFAVSHKFGSAGGTNYPTTFGHAAGAATIGVGAVPFFGTTPFESRTTITNEPFSSFGPVLSLFNPDGSPKPPEVLLKPDLSAPDFGNTSFFIPGQILDSTQPLSQANPTLPGDPATTFATPPTPVNDLQPLPTFTGTSSAAPNLAAAIALMKQANPSADRSTILGALEVSATPLNGSAKGVWNPQGGYGLANIPAAISAAASLSVVSITPGSNNTVSTAPQFLTVQFNKPVVLSSITPYALQVYGPNGATVNVGAPIGIDNPIDPTLVKFPITIIPAPGVVANGFFRTAFYPGQVIGLNGLPLATGAIDGFTLAQLNGPQITNVAFSGRVIQVSFNEPVNPATINAQNLVLFRAGGVNNPLFSPSSVIVSQFPGVAFSYDPTRMVATIDLTALPQSDFPTDHFALTITTGVTDIVGNPLNGEFHGVFPSGRFPSGAGSQFFQDLGLLSIQPPQVSFLSLTPSSDSGLTGDNNTNYSRPSFLGQITAPFGTALAGELVYAEFNGIPHPGVARGGLDLRVGTNGRGFTGNFDVQAVTDANGQFVIQYPAGAPQLPEGQNRLRVVVVGQSDSPPFPGFASSQDTAFRIDNTEPYVGTTDGSPATSIPNNASISSLANLSINVLDPVNPQTLGDPFAVDPRLAIPALDPSRASNVQNYKLYLVANGTYTDESSFISTALFVSTSARTLSSDPFTGRVDLTFGPGLPNGVYHFAMLSSATTPGGITDAAGNPFAGYAGASATGQAFNFDLDFTLQQTPTYITSYRAYTPDPTAAYGYAQSDVRSNYEIPITGVNPGLMAPPSMFTIDFSNTLNPNVDYTNAVQVIRSANSASAQPDGDFGDLGITNTSGYTRVTGINVRLDNSVTNSVYGQYGYKNRLVITLPPGATLPADYYRVYLPNNGLTAISDTYGNQLDGEFKGYLNSSGNYVDLLPNGQVRGSAAVGDLSGDGTAGGAFMTGFLVVPNGNVIYARADALYSPQVPSQAPNGTITRPFPVLAPEATFTGNNGGDLNSVVNSGANFNTNFDRSGDGQFEPSAFFAAQQRVEATGGPAVVIAVPSSVSRDPSTGGMIQKPFVLQAPSGTDPIVNDGSAAVPALTTLVFRSGTILKMQNASLFVQNQGSALQIRGGPNANTSVIVTSYKDSTVGGVSNNDPTTVGSPGDYGGIVFRNFSEAAPVGSANARTTLFPGQIPATGMTTVDQRLKGPFSDPTNPASQRDAVSGADDIMSYVNFLTERFAGGVVPQTVGIGYDGITLKNSRPTIINSSFTDTNGPNGSAQAGLSNDFDSLRIDDVAQGPLIRNDIFLRNGLNGIYLRGELNGVAEPTDAIVYPNNPSTNGGARNYAINNPYPYLLTTRLVVGPSLVQETGGAQSSGSDTDRLYIIPGMVLKFEHGSALQVSPGASLNVGDSTYIREYDGNHLVGPTEAALLPNGQVNPQAGQKTPGFTSNSANLAKVILTSLNDDAATSSFTDPISGAVTTIVQPLPAVPGGSGNLQPKPGNVPDAARWGNVLIASGAVAVLNSVVMRYGGGTVNTDTGSVGPINQVLSVSGGVEGARISVTNNIFDDNSDVPINLAPEALLAGDPQRPLESGDPFIHGNVFFNNGLNGVGVQGGTDGLNRSNLDVNSVWTGSDFTYILRDTIVLGPDRGAGIPSVPDSTKLQPILTPAVTLTLQSTLPGTILADGTTITSPGVPLLIKLLNPGNGTFPSEAPGVNPAAAIPNSFRGGAGFLVGVDNGVDPLADSTVDPGAFSQIRIVGIGANQTTGQSRVPVIITSIHDNSYGTTVNNMPMFQAMPGDTTAPKAGDGGVIYFGGNMLTDYDLQDPRNGSIVDNADIKYITRIEQQGGGIIYTFDLGNPPAGSFAPGPDNGYGTKLGYALNNSGLTTIGPYADQYNQAKQLTISNSNLSTFSDAGFIAHPGYQTIAVAGNYLNQTGIFYRIPSGYLGEATHTYFVNNTISNMPTGAEIISETSDFDQFPSPAMAVFLNNTFDSNGTSIHTIAPAFNGRNALSHVAFLAMDNIFSNNSGTAAVADGQDYGSDLQYNLFFRNQANANGVVNNQPIIGDPAYRAGSYLLLPTSAAIDVARSELGPSVFGDMLYPASTIDPTNLNQAPIRSVYDPSNRNVVTGSVNPAGGLGFARFPEDIVTLPGEPINQRGFPDEFIPVLQTPANSKSGTGINPATFAYTPLSGERDQLGNLRVKDPNSPNVGFGSRPFFDLGAFEYIIQNPPVVTAVSAVTTVGVSNLYSPGGIAGTNRVPQSIQIKFNERLDPNTINASSVILQASGGDGIFGNGVGPSDRFISLAGLLSFDPNNDTLTINTSQILSNPATLNDEYRIILKGTGSNVIRDRSGLALDGYTNGDTLPLPSGSDNFPGSDFSVTFTISTSSPSVVSGSFFLAPASDTSGGKLITRINTPTFIGSINAQFPPINAAAGQSVHIDISTRGDGNFDLIDAGVGTTDISGNFSVSLTRPIPDTPNKVGTDGIQGDPGSTFALARVRVINQAGNASDLVTDPTSAFAAKGALTGLQVDTTLPQISAFSPLANTLATISANGQVIVSVTFTKNIKNATLNTNSIQIFRSGGTGSFQGIQPIAVPFNQGSFTVQYLGDASGSERVTFAIPGPLPNDVYDIVLKGTGANPITDIAGNPLSGSFVGSFPTGGGSNQGSDFTVTPFTVFQPGQAHLIYVQAPDVNAPVGTGTVGTRENPFTTIQAAMATALIGDDVLVLPNVFGGPGVYREDVSVKPGVRLLSADLSSTDSSYLAGSANNTLIYGVAQPTPGATPGAPSVPGVLQFSNNYITTVTVQGSIFGVPTEVSGFSIISPLIGDPSLGLIDPTNQGILALNSNVVIDRNNIINAGSGLVLATSGVNAATSQVFDNVIAGNIIGVNITDTGATSSIATPFLVVNNTISDNSFGLINGSSTADKLQAYVLNNIFYSNHDVAAPRAGTGIQSYTSNTLGVGFNLFFGNGPNAVSSADDAIGLFGQFVPAALSSQPDALGNFVGNPAFVAARDPRPNGDTPAVFFLNGNYDLTGQSAAINAANNADAPLTDFLYRSPTRVPGKGFPNTGPASIGAYYYLGTGGPGQGSGGIGGGGGSINPNPGSVAGSGGNGGGSGIGNGGSTGLVPNPGNVGGIGGVGGGSVSPHALAIHITSTIGGGMAIGTRQFNVVNTTLSPEGTASASDVIGVVASEAAPSFIDINFSDNINKSTISADDLVLSGDGLDPLDPARATSLGWIDDHAIRFFLSGSFENGGTVNVSIPQGAIKDTAGTSLVGFKDAFVVASGGTVARGSLIATSNATIALMQPIAVAGPVSVAAKAIAHPAKHHPAKVAHALANKAVHHHASAKVVHQTSAAKHPKAPKANPKGHKG